MAEKIGERGPVKVLVEGGDRRRAYYFRPTRKGVYSTFAGPILGEKLVESEYGSVIELPRGRAYLLKPTWIEILENFGTRRTQVIYPKDSAYIALRLGLRPGSTVLEAGLGSGFLTAVLAAFVCPTGSIVAYEVRKEAYEAAIHNLKLAGLYDCVSARLGDVRNAEFDTIFDAAALDLPDPWEVLPRIAVYVKRSAPVAVFLPTTTQVEKLIGRVGKDWAVTSVEEILLREWEPTPGALRPSPRMIGHTGFIVFLRRLG